MSSGYPLVKLEHHYNHERIPLNTAYLRVFARFPSDPKIEEGVSKEGIRYKIYGVSNDVGYALQPIEDVKHFKKEFATAFQFSEMNIPLFYLKTSSTSSTILGWLGQKQKDGRYIYNRYLYDRSYNCYYIDLINVKDSILDNTETKLDSTPSPVDPILIEMQAKANQLRAQRYVKAYERDPSKYPKISTMEENGLPYTMVYGASDPLDSVNKGGRRRKSRRRNKSKRFHKTRSRV